MEGQINQKIAQQVANNPYADACIKMGTDYYTYEQMKIEWGDLESFEIMEKIGRGKYSDVFLGINVKTQKKVVLKVLKPIRKQKIKREIKILLNLKGGINIIPLQDILKDPASKTTTLVFDYVNCPDHRELFAKFTELDIRHYIYQLLLALDYCHSKGIMHRDVKPHNIMYDHQTRQLNLIDWGLAEFYFPGKEYNVRVASRYFKGPELLLNYEYYDYSLDIWSVGCTFAGMIFNRDPFFHGKDNYDQLEKIVRVLGTPDLQAYVKKYNLVIDPQQQAALTVHDKKKFSKLVTPENQATAVPDAVDLLSQMLVFDHAGRITAKNALKHPYFDPVRAKKE